MKNFFNAIGVADLERVHSAMIAWILDDENDNDNTQSSANPSQFSTFSKKERSSLLCGLFGVEEKEFQSIKTHVEWNDIDIMIKTKDGSGSEDVWVIENKLKSQEHMSNEKDATGKVSIWQTTKYEKIIKNYYPKSGKHYMLLSLGGDNANSSSGEWKSCTYESLFSLLNQVSSLSSHTLVNEYVSSIKKMTHELSVFLDSKTGKQNYPHVFRKLKKSEIESAGLKENERYIIENGLETIFQKCFLAEMWKKYIIKYKNSIYKNRNWSISETNGNALLDIHLDDIAFKNEKHHAQIEFQNGTFKIQFYLDGEQTPDSKNKFLNNWERVFKKEKKYKNKNEEWKVNYPKSSSIRSYISISRKICNNCNWWENEEGKILEQWNTYLKKCSETLEQIKNELNQNNHA